MSDKTEVKEAATVGAEVLAEIAKKNQVAEDEETQQPTAIHEWCTRFEAASINTPKVCTNLLAEVERGKPSFLSALCKKWRSDPATTCSDLTQDDINALWHQRPGRGCKDGDYASPPEADSRRSLSNSLLKHSRKVIPGFFAQLLLAHCLQMDSST